MAREWRDNWKHLRLPFQLSLAPIFLWGYFLARRTPDWAIAAPFAAFHLFLYTGITAFNSYFDRDSGSIGGLERPPAIHSSLLPLAIGLQAVGLPLAAISGSLVVTIYLVAVALGILYSHPTVRLKANPWASATIVCFGQGGLGFLAGWAAGGGGLASVVSDRGMLGIVAASMTTLGMYPVTQLFQIDEDRRRGDRSICIALGWRRALRLSQAAFIVAGAAGVVIALHYLTPFDAGILAAGFLTMVCLVESLQRRYESLDGPRLFRWALSLNYGSSAAFALFILTRLATLG